jgi:uncharacterized protein (UPF0335 family)
MARGTTSAKSAGRQDTTTPKAGHNLVATKHGRDLLRSLVSRIETIEDEIKERNGDKSEVYAEAKSQGFDVPAVKAVISHRRKDPDKRELQQQLLDTYLFALGDSVGTETATRVHARDDDTPLAALPETDTSAAPFHAPPEDTPRVADGEEDEGIPAFLQRQV